MRLRSLAAVLVVSIAASAVLCAQTPICHTASATAPAQGPARLRDGVGHVHMAISTASAQAQVFFDQGLALLHAFWFYEADRSFAEAARLDPECAMAQWGIAMADLTEARRSAAIKRARQLRAHASPREQLYIDAFAEQERGTRTAVQNNPSLGSTESYRQALRRIVAAFPEDVHARLFLALALMDGYRPDGTPGPGTIESVSLLRTVLTTSPDDPAAHHYLIHALEAGRPQDAVASADTYGSLVPGVGHAVHMPGHVYVHVDRWRDAAAAFERSAALDRAYMRDEHETSDHTSGPYAHNLNFLAAVYGYEGRYTDGMRIAAEMLSVAVQPGESGSRAALDGRVAALRLMVRFERWDEILEKAPDAGGFTVVEGWRHFALGLAHTGHGELAQARDELHRLKKSVEDLTDGLPNAAPQRPLQLRQSIALAVAPLELEGRIAEREGRSEAAVALLRRALDREKAIGYSEPPLYLHPMEEVLGQVLLDLRRWSDAEAMFGAALVRDPGSGRALFGLAKAQEGAGHVEIARESYSRFRTAWAEADRDLPQLGTGR
ncbi:MAG TPA: tetratricopeptide repeat protein [Vicinamibacterales bacterium]